MKEKPLWLFWQIGARPDSALFLG